MFINFLCFYRNPSGQRNTAVNLDGSSELLTKARRRVTQALINFFREYSTWLDEELRVVLSSETT